MDITKIARLQSNTDYLGNTDSTARDYKMDLRHHISLNVVRVFSFIQFNLVLFSCNLYNTRVDSMAVLSYLRGLVDSCREFVFPFKTVNYSSFFAGGSIPLIISGARVRRVPWLRGH